MRISDVVTIERFIMGQERLHPEATGELSNLLYDVALAAKIISGHVRSAGLVDILGSAGTINVQGEQQQKLDVLANEVMKEAFCHTGRVSLMASEEEEYPIPADANAAAGKYVVLFDPLDGSSNIDVNVSIGTIFSIHRRVSGDGCGNLVDCLQRGQLGILILYLMLLGFRLVLSSRSWQKAVAGGLVLALAIVFKVIPVLPVFFLILFLGARRLRHPEEADGFFRFAGTGGGVLAGLILFVWLVPSLFIGWQSNAGHLKTWARLVGTQAVATSAEAHFSNPRGPKNQSLSNALYHTGNQLVFWFSEVSEPNPWLYNDTAGRLMVSPAVTKTVLVTRVLLCLLLIPVGWRMAVRGGPLDGAAAFGMACMAMLIVSPVTRGHYFMLQWPAVLFVSLWVWNHHGSRKALLGAGIPAALSVMHYVFITFPQMFGPLQTGTLLLGTLGIGTALWYAGMAYYLSQSPPLDAPSDA